VNIETLQRGEFITITEAAKRANASPSGIRYWVRRGYVEAFRTPHGRLIEVGSLEVFLQQRQEKEKEVANV